MRLAAWRRTSSVGLGTGIAELDDNDLVKALAGVEQAKLGNMDEGFLLLDNGLGAVFSASMARRAAMQRGERLNGGPTPPATPRGWRALGSLVPPSSPRPANGAVASRGGLEGEAPGRPRGVALLRSAVRKCRKPKRLLAAQKATLELTLPPQSATARSVSSERSSSMSTGRASPTGNQELPLDPEVAAWAQRALGLPEERLKDLDSQDVMRERLGHQLLCWRALRAEKLPLPNGRGEAAAGEAPAAPEPVLLAAQALASPPARPPSKRTPRPPASARRAAAPPPRPGPWPAPAGGGAASSSPLPSPRRNLAGAALRPPRPAPFREGALPEDALPGPLPRPRAFVEPHREVASTALTGTPEFAYLRRCELRGLVPCEAAWRDFGKGAGAVDVPRRTLGDAEIGAIVETAVHCAAKGHVFQVLDLGGNALSNKGLKGMAELLGQHQEACSQLTTLSLAGNAPLKLHSEDVLGELKRVFSALPALTSLDLSGVRVHGQAASKLVEALEACSQLRSLSLVGCGLGQFQEAECVAIASLFRHPDLEHVDLSGNFFGCAGFAAAGDALRHSKLKKLSFSGNSSMLGSTTARGPGLGPREREEKPFFHPLQLLIEGFQANATLTEIDLSACGMGPDTAFVLEDALHSHPSVTSLSLADNPLGDAGLRCVIRLLLDSKSRVGACHVQGHREADDTAAGLTYRSAQPGGIYRLNMRYPHERATLRTLLRLGENMRSGALRPFRFDPKMPKPTVMKDPEGDFWVVPTQGTYNFTYQLPLSKVAQRLLPMRRSPQRQLTQSTVESGGASSPGAPPKGQGRGGRRASVKPFRFGNHGPWHLEPRAADSSPGPVLVAPKDRPDPRPTRTGSNSPFQMLDSTNLAATLECSWVEVSKLLQDARTQVSPVRFPLLRGMFLALRTQDEQLRYVRALAKDMSFNAAQVSKLCEDRPEIAVQTAVSLFPAISGRAAQLMLLGGISEKRAADVSKAANSFLWFQEGNVTGRYRLDLSESADYAVAERVLLVNAWETEVARIVGRPNVSQRGNYEMLRNETLNDEPFTYGRDWGLPSHGWLFFDYSSIRRPPATVGAMPEMNEVPKYLRSAALASPAKLKALRAVSVHMYMSTQQFKNIMNCFEDGSEDYQELFCILHTRVVDPGRLLGPEVLRSTMLRDADRQGLLKRIGHLHLLNPLHPEDVSYHCCLRVYEERMVVDFLVQLAVKEPGGRVVGAAVGANGRVALPVSWADTGVPDEDIEFCCTYDTKTANMPWRQTLAERYTVGFSGGVGTPASRPQSRT